MNSRTFAVCLALTVLLAPSVSFAHRSGCHNLHTCSSDTNTYVCGDLGYPCNGVTSIEQIDPATIFVPLATEKMFTEIFGRKPTDIESAYWKKRFRSDKNSIYKLRPAMLWHKNKGSASPAVVPARVDMVKEMNTMFASVYDGRMPTPSEYKYWISRIKDKPTPPAMVGAMHFHKLKGIAH
jgi:hypothetical protein